MVLQSPSQISDILRERDFLALRQALKNWSPSAAHVFELLELSVQEQLLKAMGQEELAGLLNNMASDDRTLLLEELRRS